MAWRFWLLIFLLSLLLPILRSHSAFRSTGPSLPYCLFSIPIHPFMISLFFPLLQPGGFSFSSGFIVIIIIIYPFSSKSEVQSKQVSLLQYMYQLPSRVETVKFFKIMNLIYLSERGMDGERGFFFVFFSFPKSEFWTALFHKEKKEYYGVHNVCGMYL